MQPSTRPLRTMGELFFLRRAIIFSYGDWVESTALT